jgi:hypothetical protein
LTNLNHFWIFKFLGIINKNSGFDESNRRLNPRETSATRWIHSQICSIENSNKCSIVISSKLADGNIKRCFLIDYKKNEQNWWLMKISNQKRFFNLHTRRYYWWKLWFDFHQLNEGDLRIFELMSKWNLHLAKKSE